MTQTPSTPRPVAPAVCFENIPGALKERPRWVLWKYVWRESAAGAKWTKLPLQLNGKAASSTDPRAWDTFEAVKKAYERTSPTPSPKADGVGFVFSKDDDLVGVDLDDCLTTDALDNTVMSPMAEDLLASVPGYAEVSPSGAGIKMWVRATGMPRAFAEKALGLEFYPAGRFFTVTGNRVTSEFPQELKDDHADAVRAWLSRWLPDGDARATASSGDADEADLASLKTPVEGWDLERTVNALLSKLDASMGYKEWLEVGMALHHQFDGAPEALEAWDAWSANSEKYTEGLCDEKWDSFNEQHVGGSVTLRSLLKALPANAVATSVDRVKDAIDKINQVETGAELEGPVCAKLRKADLSDLEREQLASAIQKRIQAIDGTRVPISTVRSWLLQRRTWNPFPDVTADGAPLGTHGNVAEVLSRMGASVRYNVISKEDEILIPGEGYTLDNVANASLARVVSECAKYEVPIGQVKAYITLLADQNQYNPAMAWVESREWDGLDRLSSLADTLVVAPEYRTLRALLLRRWLIGAVAIAHNTGETQARGILTLQGGENKGKSRWLRSLCPPELALVRTGHTLDVHRVDSIKQGVSCWLLELGELDGTFKRSDMAALKAWASQQVDILRKPYAAAEGQYPRRTALFASVNDPEFLQGNEGNTRFWVLAVQSVVHEHGIDMQQVWAQVMTYWKAGERHWLDEAEGQQLDASNQDYVMADPIDEMVRSRFSWSAVRQDDAGGGQWLTATEVLQLCGLTKLTASDLKRCAACVRRLNGNRQKKSTDTTRRRLLWVPPARGSAEAEFEEEHNALL